VNNSDQPLPVLLVIDDEEEFLETAEIFFRRRGFRVLTASSEDEVFAAVSNGPVSYILVDYFLGEVDGLSLIAGIQQRVEKVALLSGYVSNDLAAQCDDMGVEVFRKPVDLGDISDFFHGK